MRGRRLLWALAGLVVVAVVVATLAAPAVVRAKAIASARARGVELQVGRVRLGWFRAELGEVRATLEGARELTIEARSVVARVGFSGVGDVEARGVAVSADGDPATIRRSLEAWRARHPSPAATTSGGGGRTYTVHELTARWRVLGVEPASAAVREIVVSGGRIIVRGGDATLKLPVAEVRAAGVDTEIARADGRLGAFSAATVALQLEPSIAGTVGAAATIPLAWSDEPAEAPPSEKPAAPSFAAAPASADPWSLLARVRGPMERLLARFESGVEIKIAEITISAKQAALGPWSARAVLGADAVAFELDPGEKAGRKPLVLRALVPRDRGKWTAELKMGPATLAELGVAEGTLGLADVATASVEARGSIELDPQEKTFAADGALTLKGASINDARIADGPVQGIDVGARGVLASKGDLRTWTLTGGSIELGKVRLDLEGGFESIDLKDGKRGPRLWASWSVPTVACGDALSSMPKGLLPKLEGMEMQGTFGARGRVGFDARLPDKTEVDLFLDQKCRITKVPPALSVDRFKEPFELRVYDPKGNPKTARFGPGTPEWVSSEKLSPYVVDALMVCEDGAFFAHNGFSAGAIRNAIIANIKAGKFALGASTITMQLTKNVFLDRRKQLSRKLQEAVLTAWLEQAMSKSELLELYVNVIEYGPNLYGIGPASWHWFGRPASDLDPAEATFLISLLPSPVKRHFMWDKGAPSEGYLQYVRALLKEERARGKLDEDEYQAAIASPLKFHKPGDPAPPPHAIQPVKGPIDKSGADDAAFDPGGLSPPAE
ncbi:MAG: transglycosylase domain-containing protein [Deltaproteobacteria bacterium]|nr:transglycosylase domain-containing protein [Deltaproteobacteria bacterium]